MKVTEPIKRGVLLTLEARGLLVVVVMGREGRTQTYRPLEKVV